MPTSTITKKRIQYGHEIDVSSIHGQCIKLPTGRLHLNEPVLSITCRHVLAFNPH
ncbi:hypothetical protein SLEP1_g24461 [Rubroshorea leprosula]|uniref:Uncharacterized protein n=1 Tax=Rubroshorea leprosula TaxID=152421 RepID=A0AAV5JG18_9ROSI|nr:hypothetical protein SLEP1_g24461 [Rubroshorea leprosula]